MLPIRCLSSCTSPVVVFISPPQTALTNISSILCLNDCCYFRIVSGLVLYSVLIKRSTTWESCSTHTSCLTLFSLLQTWSSPTVSPSFSWVTLHLNSTISSTNSMSSQDWLPEQLSAPTPLTDIWSTGCSWSFQSSLWNCLSCTLAVSEKGITLSPWVSWPLCSSATPAVKLRGLSAWNCWMKTQHKATYIETH